MSQQKGMLREMASDAPFLPVAGSIGRVVVAKGMALKALFTIKSL